MRLIVPLIACLLAACNADQPEAPDTQGAADSTSVADKANADVEAALAEASKRAP